MEPKLVLGIAVSRQEAMVAVIDTSRPNVPVEDCFRAAVDSSASGALSLGAAIGRAIRSRNLPTEGAVVSLRSDFYAQYPVRSSFSDPRQIDQTIKFDAEEAAAADAATLAVA